MSIITRQDLIDHYGDERVARASSDGGDSIDEPSLAKWIAVANGRVMSYLLAAGIEDVSNLPQSSVDSIKNAARVVTWYWLWGDGYTDDMRQDFKDEIKWLEKVSASPKMLTGKSGDNPSKSMGAIRMVRS